MSEKGTYSDPRCCTCNPPGWREVDGVALPPITWADHGPKPYHTSGRAPDIDNAITVTVTGRLEGSYNRFADRIAEAINKRIPGPDLNNDVLRKARSE